MNEKRLLVASVFSAVFLALYVQVVMKPSPALPKQPRNPKLLGKPATLEQPATSPIQQTEHTHLLENDSVITIESKAVQVVIGEPSGAIRQVLLKEALGGPGGEPLRFGGNVPIFAIHTGQEDQDTAWKLIRANQGTAEFEGNGRGNKNHHISYILSEENPILSIKLSIKNPIVKTEKIEIIHSWAKADHLSNRYNALEFFLVTDKGDGKNFYRRYTVPTRAIRDLQNDVPRGTRLLSLSERYFCQSIKPSEPFSSVLLFPNEQDLAVVKTVAAPTKLADGSYEFSETVYFGPRDFFYLKRAGFSSAFPIGVIGQIGLILLVILNGIAKLTHNYGVAIILFSVIITALSSPFTLLSFRSMRKMQELKPTIDKIMAKHKDDSRKANQEILALYKENHVSPLGGCLPMLLQMPVFFAMFQAISHYIELRGKRFLWISDLSLPDRISQLPIALPMLGKDLNLLPVIMAITMFLQTKMSQKNMAVDSSNPSAQLMSGPLMPILFGVMFYQFPSGLVLYWLTNSLMSLVLYKMSTGDPKKSTT